MASVPGAAAALRRFQFPDRLLPLVVSPAAAAEVPLAEWLPRLRDELEGLQADLRRYGALLLRGFPIRTAEDMQHVVLLFGATLLDYVGGAVPRSRIRGNIFNSTELNRHYTIRIHNELAYQPSFPRLICFFCQTPARAGGETILADCRTVLRALPADVVERFRRHRMRYVRVFQDTKAVRESVKRVLPTYFHMTWQHVFHTTDRAEAEAACRRLEMEYAWRPSGDLVVTTVLPVVVDHAGTGEDVWFSHLNLFYPIPRVLGWPVHLSRKLTYRRLADTPNQVTYGDGSPIGADDANRVFDAIEGNTVSFPWQRGDLMIVDNRLVGHGRNPYRGERRVLVSMHS